MPLYKFECDEHGEFEDLVKFEESGSCPICDKQCEAMLPTGSGQATMETRDKHRGKKVRKGNEGQLRARMINNQNENELADLIDKHGMTEAKRNGWLKKIKKL